MRNEIFARHGYIFHINPEMQGYFNGQDWYRDIPKTTTDGKTLYQDYLSGIEKHNINIISQYESNSQ